LQKSIDDRQFARIVADFINTHRLEGFIHVGEGRPEPSFGEVSDCFYDTNSGRFWALKSARTGWGIGAKVHSDRDVFNRIQLAVQRQQAAGER